MPQTIKYDRNGNEVEDVNLSETVFEEEINEPLVHKVINSQLAAKRRGTASTKTRSEVRGGGRKPWRQKGTGRARHGSIRSPLWVGGGITFGPKPRSYEKKVTKKEKRNAMRAILTDKVNTDSLIVLDELELPEIGTKQVVELLDKLELDENKVLILLPEKDEKVYLSARNIPEVNTLVLDALNAYDLLNNDIIVMSEKALRAVEEVLSE
ncbi:MAG: 50S ribosomal protein L4 [Halanaerobiaceae bacterium]